MDDNRLTGVSFEITSTTPFNHSLNPGPYRFHHHESCLFTTTSSHNSFIALPYNLSCQIPPLLTHTFISSHISIPISLVISSRCPTNHTRSGILAEATPPTAKIQRRRSLVVPELREWREWMSWWRRWLIVSVPSGCRPLQGMKTWRRIAKRVLSEINVEC